MEGTEVEGLTVVPDPRITIGARLRLVVGILAEGIEIAAVITEADGKVVTEVSPSAEAGMTTDLEGLRLLEDIVMITVEEAGIGVAIGMMVEGEVDRGHPIVAAADIIAAVHLHDAGMVMTRPIILRPLLNQRLWIQSLSVHKPSLVLMVLILLMRSLRSCIEASVSCPYLSSYSFFKY